MANQRHILLTGGTSGIGLALTRRLALRHRMVVTARKMSPQLQALTDAGADITFAAADFTDPQSAVATIWDAIAERGWHHLDNAILNAGMGQVGDPVGETEENIRQTLAVNLTTNMALAHRLFPLLERDYGRLTFIGSTARKGAPNFASYAASKAGLHGFARSLRSEWKGRVSVQVLHPGATRTPMHAKAGFDPGALAALFVSPDDMAIMLEKAIARGTPFANFTALHFWGGGSIRGRGLV